MGIFDPEEINRYSVQTIDEVDLLRIVYTRKKGSLLAASKRFRFPRTEKMALGDGQGRETQMYTEVSPELNKAMVELDKIVRGKRERSHQLELIKEEVKRLSEETQSRIAYINSLIEDLD